MLLYFKISLSPVVCQRSTSQPWVGIQPHCIAHRLMGDHLPSQTHGIFSISRRASKPCFAGTRARQCTSLSLKTFHHLPGGKHDIRSAFKDERMHLHHAARILCVFLPRRGPYSRHSCFRMEIHKWEGSSRRPPDVMGLHCSTELSASVFNSKFSTELTLRSSATPAALFAAI